MTYTIEITAAAARALKKLTTKDRTTAQRLAKAIDKLATNPRPDGAVALQGEQATVYRIRVGNWRVLYTVDDGRLVVLVLSMGHRRDVYR